MKIRVIPGVIVLLLVFCTPTSVSQVCSTIGGLCQKTTDCCRGCCEAYVCVDRPHSCSPDLVAIPGRNSCEKYHCSQGELCFLAEVCPPENPCPMAPHCRKIPGDGYNGTHYPGRNSAFTVTTSRLYLSNAVSTAAVAFFYNYN